MWYEFDEEQKKIFIRHPRTIGFRWIRNEEVPEILEYRHRYSNDVVLKKIDKNGTHYYESSLCPSCSGDGYVVMGAEAEEYSCFKCDGTGVLPKKRTYKVHTAAYGKILEAKRIKKKSQKFFEEQQLNEDGSTYVYLGKTYPIREELKAKGAKWDSLISAWRSKMPLEGYPVLKVKMPLRVYPDGYLYYDFGSESGRYVTIAETPIYDVINEIKQANENLKNSALSQANEN